MNKEDLFELMKELENSSFITFEYQNGNEIIRLSKSDQVFLPGFGLSTGQGQENLHQSSSSEKREDLQDARTEDRTYYVTAPMVGNFYRASSPEEEAFVEEGDMVEEGDVLFILEAMKMFNEIKSPVKGRVLRILKKDGELAQYDEKLIEIEVEDV